jgi:predicted PolB exonuclease-like 3'-5' exonuclease
MSVLRETVWAFDAEWVPDAALGRRLYGLAPETPDAAVFAEMWRRGGASDDNPRPYLKTVLCQVVSLAVVRRTGAGESAALSMVSLSAERLSEAGLLAEFFASAARERPLLVGFNSRHADLPIMIQRGVVHGLAGAEFQKLDYLAWKTALHVDLMAALGWGGRSTPSLDELATACGVPGKIDTHGGDVAELWLAGRHAEIMAYNELDAIATYLVWLRWARFEGHLSGDEYEREQEKLERFLVEGAAERPHFRRYLERWRLLRRPATC